MKHNFEVEPGIFRTEYEFTEHTFSYRIIDYTGETDDQGQIVGEVPPLEDDRWRLMYHIVGRIDEDNQIITILDPPLYAEKHMDLVFCVEHVMFIIQLEMLLYNVHWDELERMKLEYDSFRNNFSDYGK